MNRRPLIIRNAILTGVFALLCVASLLLCRFCPPAVEGIFVPVQRFLTFLLRSVTSIAPFSVAEALVCALIPAAAALIVFAVLRLARSKEHRRAAALHGLSIAAAFASAATLVFILAWGSLYYAEPLGETLGIDVRQYSTGELYKTSVWVRDNLNAAAAQAPEADDGTPRDFWALADKCANGYSVIGKLYPQLDGASANTVKPVFFWPVMSCLGIDGIYVPFTGECNINAGLPVCTLPFSICHELAHSLGVAPEDEANFLAFLACKYSNEPEYKYSGWFIAFVYCSNALSQSDPSLQAELWLGLDDRVTADILSLIKYNEQYEGPARETGKAVNDAFLKAMDQPEGVRSYGRVVDLIIADYLSGPGDTLHDLLAG